MKYVPMNKIFKRRNIPVNKIFKRRQVGTDSYMGIILMAEA